MASKKQLIDKEKLLDKLCWLAKNEDQFRQSVICGVMHTIAVTPTVEAVEVVHGRWDIFDDGYGCELMCCSVCKAEFYDGYNNTVDHPHNYCPNCGADMRERKDNE